VDDPLLVRRFERLGDLLRNPQGVGDRHRTLRQTACQSRAVNELEDEGSTAAAVFESVDLRDVGMIERSKDLRLASKSAEPLGVGDEQLRQDLDGDVPIQFRIARAIHLAHAAGPEGRQHFVGAEASTRLQGHNRRDERLYEDTGEPIITMPSESRRDQTPSSID